MTWIEEYLDYPEECEYGIKIDKKQVYEEAQLKTRDKNIFTKTIEKITWSYHLKPETLNIPSYHDKTRIYDEIEVIEIQLRECTKTNRIADIMLRSIPYPLLLIFEYDTRIRIYASHIREHGSDSTKITFDDNYGMISTDWINLEQQDEISIELIEKLKLENLNNTNMLEMYKDIYNAIIIYNGSRKKGEQTIKKPEEIKKRLDLIRKYEYEISLNKNQIKEETNFNEKMKLNVKNRKLKDKIKATINEL